jgi:two-component sensor histidine kinase
MKLWRWVDEFRDGWRGKADPSLTQKLAFAAFCLAAATAVRYGFSLIRNDVPFTPYYPAILFVTVFAGFEIGSLTAILGGVLGLAMGFVDSPVGPARVSLFLIYLIVSVFVIWGAQHHRSIATHYRGLSKKLTDEENYRKLVIDELEHRLKNKLVTIHAVIHQVLRNRREDWKKIDGRIRALSSTDELIAKADSDGCDLKELLNSELEPYGHVRFTLDGDAIHLPAKLAVSLALIFHELATNAAKYGAFASSTGLLHVEWTLKEHRLHIRWDESGGPLVGPPGESGFGTKLLKSALLSFDGNTETTYLPSGIICSIDCAISAA